MKFLRSLFPRAYEPDPPAAVESDYGRRYGWFVEQNGERVGELDYVRWDSELQFWHEYRVSWIKERSGLEGDPDAWIHAKLSLRNRRFLDVVVTDYLTSARGIGCVAIRAASVPRERFRQDEKG